MKQILIVEDDLHIGNVLEEACTRAGYDIYRAYSGSESLLILNQKKFDLVLLDLMLPGLSGDDVLPLIEGIPVIVVSAKADVDEKVKLLSAGAVDYITKPFHVSELLARIAIQFRLTPVAHSLSSLTFRDITLDCYSHVVNVDDNQVTLTRTEFAILKLLMENPKQVMSKSILLEMLSHDTPDCMESSLKVHISNLRKKLRKISDQEYIESVWGIGFKLINE